MSQKPDIWMPLYIADYLADTQDLDAERHGAYLLLLMAAWMRGGKLPSDDRKLATIARCTPAQWRRVRSDVAAFFDVEGDEWIQRRLLAEYEHAVKVNDAQRVNGKKGGRPKKTETQQKPTGFDRANPNHNPNETPSHSQSPAPPSDGSSSSDRSVVLNTLRACETPATTAGEACKAMRSAGLMDSNSSHPGFLALIAEGATAEQFAHAATQAVSRGKGFAYAIGVLRGQFAEAATTPKGKNPTASNRAAAAAWLADEPIGAMP